MLVAKTDDIEKYENDLKKFRFKAYPFATKETLNSIAFKTQKLARAQAGRKMILRNTFTKKSILVHKAKTLQLSRQSALVGSTEKYMERQEFGAIERSRGKVGLSIPTSYSAGQEGSKPRTRAPEKANRIQNIRLSSRKNTRQSSKQRNFLAVQRAAQSKVKFLFMDLGKRKGIFKIVGGQKKTKVKMVQDLTKKTITIKRNPWLKPATKAVEKHIPGFYEKSLMFQLKRFNLYNQ